jgi:outer membrane protein assembly factor BamB
MQTRRMRVQDLVRTRRWAFIAVLALVVVGATVTSARAASPNAPAAACPSYQIFGVRGSGETKSDGNGYGNTVNAVRNNILSHHSGGASTPIDYPAISVQLSPTYLTADYWASETEGELVLQNSVEGFARKCKTTPLILIGYSQGAHAAGDVYALLSSRIRANVVALVLLGDTRFNPAQSTVDIGSYNAKLKGIWASAPFAATLAKPERSVRTFTAGESAAVHSYCLLYDPVCNYSAANGVNCVPGLYCVHTHYVDFDYTTAAAQWALTRLPGQPRKLALLTGALPSATVKATYRVPLAATGGRMPYHWTATGTLLNDGLSFDTATGMIVGIPRRSGIFTLSVKVQDAANASASRAFTIVVASLPQPPPPTGSANWPSTFHDGGMSNFNPGEKTITAANVGKLTQRWNVDENTFSQDGPAVIVGGVVYRIGSNADQHTVLEARTLTTGTLQWSLALGIQNSHGLIGVSGGVIVCECAGDQSSEPGALSGRSVADGHLIWTYNERLSGYPVALDNTRIVVGAPGTNLSLLDAGSGAKLWTSRSTDLLDYAVAGSGFIVANGYELDADGHAGGAVLEGIDESDGSVRWRLPAEPAADSAGTNDMMISGTTMYATNYDSGALQARDVRTGVLLWQAENYNDSITGTWIGHPATDGSTVYAATQHYDPATQTNPATVRAFAAGRELWHTDLPEATNYADDVVLANGIVYVQIEPVGTNPRATVVALDATTGAILWAEGIATLGVQQLQVGDGYILLEASDIRAYAPA